MNDSTRTFGALVLTALLALGLLSVTGMARAGGTQLPADDNSHPSPFVWTNGNVAVTFEGESPSFHIASVHQARVNVSVSVTGLGEVNPQGQRVAYAPFSGEGVAWNLSWTNVSGGLMVNLTGSPTVFTASGPWNGSGLPEEGGFGSGLGGAGVVLTFHLFNAGNASAWKVKFDLTASHWPWISNSDSLGVVMAVQAEQETQLTTPVDDSNVTEREPSNGIPVASLTWAPTATVTYASGQTAVANVTANTSISGEGSSSSVHLLFGGVNGGYTSLFYDPAVWMNPGAFSSGSSLVAWLVTPLAIAVITAGAVLVLTLGMVALKIRRRAPSSELSGALPTCPACGSPLSVETGSGVRILSCSTCELRGHSPRPSLPQTLVGGMREVKHDFLRRPE